MSLNEKDSGFILMESLISLSILALFIGVVFPFSMELFTLREQMKTDVELNRFLYESAKFYDKNEPKQQAFTSGNVSASGTEDEEGIYIYHEEDRTVRIDFISAEWTLSK